MLYLPRHMARLLLPERPMPSDPSERTLDELATESARLEAATLYLQEWAAALELRSAVLHRLTQGLADRRPSRLAS